MRFTKREIDEGNGGSMFLKIKDGESVVGVFRGEVYEFYSKWENGKSQVVLPTDPEAKTRFRLNFVVYENNQFTAKVWEFGLKVYNQLADLADEYDLSETKVKITRRGMGTDTTYSVIPSKESVKPEALKKIEAVPLNVLEHRDTPKASGEESF